MAFLVPTNYEDERNVDYTADYWMLNTGPFGVSGFCQDGVEVGSYCYICEMGATSSQSRTHFEMKRHCQKVKAIRTNKTRLIIEPSTGGDMNDPDNLFLSNHCKVCDAMLSTPEQQSAHYMSEKHQKKVRNYFLVKVGIREKKAEAEKEDVLKRKSKSEYCALCKIELSAPVVAQDHYAGKKHAKKLREQMEADAAASVSGSKNGDNVAEQKHESELTVQKEEVSEQMQE